ncbi:hypothetical protein AAGT00_00230 (plasmid) [Streptomyces cavourensis]
MNERPDWARRMAEGRAACDWSHAYAVRAPMVRLPDGQEVGKQDPIRQWNPWERGDALQAFTGL